MVGGVLERAGGPGAPTQGGAPVPPGGEATLAPSVSFPPQMLYITVSPDAAVRIGTCAHCVIFEQERPERAWDPNGDQDLDFDREALFACLAELGICLTERQAYVCP